MTVIKRVGVLSVGKVVGCLYALIGLIAGGLISLASLLGMGAGGGGNMLLGIGAIVYVPVIYGVLGFIGGLITGAIYNVVAAPLGGIELELVETSSSGRKYSRSDDNDDDDRGRSPKNW